jgi:hypothetical protein
MNWDCVSFIYHLWIAYTANVLVADAGWLDANLLLFYAHTQNTERGQHSAVPKSVILQGQHIFKLYVWVKIHVSYMTRDL